MMMSCGTDEESETIMKNGEIVPENTLKMTSKYLGKFEKHYNETEVFEISYDSVKYLVFVHGDALSSQIMPK